MKLELSKQECQWLGGLVNKVKTEAARSNEESPHPLLELRRDNMAALESKIGAAIGRQMQRDGRGSR